MRGYYTRKFVIPKIKAVHSIAEDYVVRKVNEWLEVSYFLISY